jgi:hypothetical protein
MLVSCSSDEPDLIHWGKVLERSLAANVAVGVFEHLHNHRDYFKLTKLRNGIVF